MQIAQCQKLRGELTTKAWGRFLVWCYHIKLKEGDESFFYIFRYIYAKPFLMWGVIFGSIVQIWTEMQSK
jgi:hypothetical protein